MQEAYNIVFFHNKQLEISVVEFR